MSNIAIIPARGGSKRIPRKNIKDFLGKPIIAYSIEAAIKSNIFDEVMVSTDDEEIADVSRKYGAKVPFFRSKEMSDDYATTSQVLLEVIKEYHTRGMEFNYMACIYPTAPFIEADDLKKAFKIMEDRKPTMVMPVVSFSYPPQRSYIIDSQGKAVFKYPQFLTARSQDLEKLYREVGQYYVYDIAKFVTMNARILDDIIPIVIDERQAQDIDTDEDWKMAELKYKLVHPFL